MRSELGTRRPGRRRSRRSARSTDKFMECQKRGLERVEVLAGKREVLPPHRRGRRRPKWAYLEDAASSATARPRSACSTSCCGARWPKPDGGEAEARYVDRAAAAGDAPRQRLELRQGRRRARQARRRHRPVQGRRERARSTRRCTSAPAASVTRRRASRTSNKDGEDDADCLDGRPAEDEGAALARELAARR